MYKIRKFKHLRSDDFTEVRIINTETGDFTSWCESDGLCFSKWHDNVLKMGWPSVKEFIKKRCNRDSRWEEVREPEDAE